MSCKNMTATLIQAKAPLRVSGGKYKCYKLGFHAWRNLGAVLLSGTWQLQKNQYYMFALPGGT